MKKTLYFVMLSALVLATAGFGANPARAAAAITALATANISADSTSGNSVALPSFSIAEAAAGDISAGALTWALPAGFVFDTTASSSVAFAGAGLGGSATVNYPNNTHVSVTITSTSTAAGMLTVGAATPLKVRAAVGNAMASGNITLSGGVIAGISSSTNFGTLTEVAGAPNKLAFTLQPPAAVNANANFSANVGVQDQFGNLVSSDNGRNISLSVNLLGNTAGSLSGALSQNDSSGIASYNNLMFNNAGQIQLQAASTNLATTVSTNIAVSASTTAVTQLQNGTLVMFQGNPTVYIVINGTLRPFISAAVFHRHGKKFEDIEELNNDDFFRFQIGRPIDESDDEDLPPPTVNTSTPPIIIPPVTTTTTPPAISGLPDGSVVKLPNDPTVYLVSNGQLQAFTSLGIFDAWGKNFSQVMIISPSQFSGLSLGAPVGLPNGVLVQGSGQTIFVIQNGEKFGIPSMNVFRNHGWSLNNIIHLSGEEINRFSSGGLED